jgi:membrane-associated protein
MHGFEQLIQYILHFDYYLALFVHTYGAWAYAALFLIIFCETGLVVTPLLPGDTLLFAAGSLAAVNALDIKLLMILLFCAALLGDSTNYWIARKCENLLEKVKDRWYFKKKYLEKTHDFYAKYGGKTLIIARFIPIIRTFAPFVAGLARMPYPRFLTFSLIGNLLWIGLLTLAGYLFSHIPVVKNNFMLVIVAIIFISLLPAIIEFIRHRRKASN